MRKASGLVIARPRRGRGALSAKREEVPLGCNLGKAVALIAHAIVGERTAGPGDALTVRTSHRQKGKRFRFVIARRLSAFFLIHFSVFRIHSFPCPAPTANSPARRKKSSDLSIGASCWRYLSFRAVTRKVLSAQMSLTSVFGMGTGVPSPQSTPTIWGHTLKTEQE